jgi:hypothetical protein
MLCLFLHRSAEFRSNLQKAEDILLSFVGDEEVRMVDNKELESGLKAMAGRDRGTARATLGEGLSVSAFPLYVPV